MKKSFRKITKNILSFITLKIINTNNIKFIVIFGDNYTDIMKEGIYTILF